MRHPVLTALVAALILALLPSAPVSAQKKSESPVLARIVKSGKVRVGMSGSQPPLNFRGKDGEMMGFEVDIANGLATLMGVELEIVQMPFGELLGALGKNKVDLVMSGVTITPERNLRMAFVGPYTLSGKSILTKSKTLAASDETSDLDQSDLKLAALAGSTSQSFVEIFMPKAKLTTTADYDGAVQLLLDDDVHAVVADFEIVMLSAFRHPEASLATLNEPFTIEPIGIAVPPGDPLLVNFLENTLGALEVSGALSEVRRLWFQRGDWLQQLP